MKFAISNFIKKLKNYFTTVVSLGIIVLLGGGRQSGCPGSRYQELGFIRELLKKAQKSDAAEWT